MDLWATGPHLSVFVFTRGALLASLVKVVGLLREDGCEFAGRAVVAERGPFKSSSDVACEEVAVEGTAEEWLEGLAGSEKVPTRLAFRRPRVSAVTLRLSMSGRIDEPNPLEICCHAGGLGIPVQVRTREDRRSAKWLVSWTERLLPRLVASVDGDYGAIGVEAELPTPSQFKAVHARDPLLPYAWLVPQLGAGGIIRMWDPVSGEATSQDFSAVLWALRGLEFHR